MSDGELKDALAKLIILMADKEEKASAKKRERMETATPLTVFSNGSPAVAEDWLNRLDIARTVGGWSDECTQSVLFTKLGGAAAYWHSDHGINLPYDKWKAAFEEAFIPSYSKQEIMTMLMNSRQEKGEDLNLFARRTEHLAKKLGWELNDTKLVILKGLRADYSFMFHTVLGREHATVTKLVKDIEDTMRCEQARREFSGAVGGKRSDRVQSNIVCYGCGVRGHRKFECTASTVVSGEVRASTSGQASTGKAPALKPEASGAAPRGQSAAASRQGSAQDGKPKQAAAGSDVRPKPKGCFTCGIEGHIAKYCPGVVQLIEEEKGASECAEAVEPDPAVKVVAVNGREWTARVDTEAAVSVISERAAEQLGLSPDSSVVQKLRGVGGEPFDTLGKVQVTLEADELQLKEVELTVLPTNALMSDDILLGKDLLSQGLVVVCCEGESWILDKEESFAEIARILPKRRRDHGLKLQSAQKVTLAPRSISMVKVVPSEEKEGLILMSEPPGGDQEQWGALCEVSGKKELAVPVANLKESVVILEQGTVVARGREADDENFFRLRWKAPGEINQLTLDRGNEDRRFTEKELDIGDNVAQTVRDELVEMVNEFRDVVAVSMKELGLTELTQFDIEEIPESKPVRSRPYRLSMVERDALREIVQQLIDAGMIERSKSEYASPVLLVRKADGGFRLVIDYRRLNAQTVKLNYPLPLIDDVLDGVAGKAIFSTFDLAWGYFQIPMTEKAAEKAAFVTPEGHFQPKVLMMGLCNAPARFQELMVQVRDMIGKQQAFPYLDDLITASARCKEHMEQIRRVFEALRAAGLTIRLEKCRFFQEGSSVLGIPGVEGRNPAGNQEVKSGGGVSETRGRTQSTRVLGLDWLLQKVHNWLRYEG